MPVNPVVSVCVPTYNGAAYLAECLDSILAQTFTDFEVLIVDDCSRDDTLAIAEQYARRDPRVRVLRNEHNLGLVGNWNRCVEIAQGEWIKFVFQDDLIAPTCLDRMLAVGRNGHLLVGCARDFIFDPGTRESDRDFYLWHEALLESLLTESTTPEQFSEITLDDRHDNLLGEPTAVLLHRSVFTRFGPFNGLMVQIVDGEYWARVGTTVGVAFISDVLATFRVHPASTSTLNNMASAVRTRLDTLIVRHEFAFNPVYAPLRAVARSRRPDRDLTREFWDRAYVMLWTDGVAAALAHGDERSRAHAERVYTAYPRLRRVRRHAARYAISNYFGRHRTAARAYLLAKHAAARGVALLGITRAQTGRSRS